MPEEKLLGTESKLSRTETVGTREDKREEGRDCGLEKYFSLKEPQKAGCPILNITKQKGEL